MGVSRTRAARAVVKGRNASRTDLRAHQRLLVKARLFGAKQKRSR
jgi:hypothetical protein